MNTVTGIAEKRTGGANDPFPRLARPSVAFGKGGEGSKDKAVTQSRGTHGPRKIVACTVILFKLLQQLLLLHFKALDLVGRLKINLQASHSLHCGG